MAPTAISILNKRAGPNTRALYEAEPGDRVACLGPLGQPFTPVPAPTEAWMVAGGVGLAPFATLAEIARRDRRADHAVLRRALGPGAVLSRFLRAARRDARARHRGRQPRRARPRDGPARQAPRSPARPAPRRSTRAAPSRCSRPWRRRRGVTRSPREVSVERVMGCGLGGCYSCVIPVKHDGGPRISFARASAAPSSTAPTSCGTDGSWIFAFASAR